MREKQICISKQTTFILLIFFLLLGYIFFAYRTMVNPTTIDSRASGTNQASQSNLFSPPPTDEQLQTALVYSATWKDPGLIQLNGVDPELPIGSRYSIQMKKNESFIHLDTFDVTSETLAEKFHSYWAPQNPVSKEDILTKDIFFLIKVK